MNYQLQFSPLLPDILLWTLAAIAFGLAAVGLVWQRGILILRALVALGFVAALFNPLITNEERSPIKDVVALVVDTSASQKLGERPAQMREATAQMAAKLSATKGVDLRTIDVPQSDDGTLAFAALREGLKDVAPERVGGVIMLTDGQVHDVPNLAGLGFHAPLHVLLTGHEGEFDRRIEAVETPKFGIVGKDVTLKLRVIDSTKGGPPGQLKLRRDGADFGQMSAAIGALIEVKIPLEHAGANVVEIELAALPGELTTLNNRLIVSVEGVRDRVRVLLVSGAPNPGERAWRNVLKSDPNIDLIHYTILRLPSKVDTTPISELALIGFPIDQLFSRDIAKFDLIIFDRYANQSPLPDYYFDNLATYVRDGGALMVNVGADYADEEGLGRSALGQIMPATPTGDVVVKAFVPQVSRVGSAHPVMRGLSGEKADWAAFYRLIGARADRGDVLMTGADNQPLMVLAREQKGRVALMLSDQMWLWARGVNGGGPQVELLRRMTHWLLKEPQLEEEALRAKEVDGGLEIERQSLVETVNPVSLTGPDGTKQNVVLNAAGPGLWRARIPVEAQGLYALEDGALHTFAPVGIINLKEFEDVVSTPDKLQKLADETGGSVRRMDSGGVVHLPSVASMRAGSHYSGADYIGVKRNEISSLTGLTSAPVALGFPGLLALGGLLLALWLKEAFWRPLSRGKAA